MVVGCAGRTALPGVVRCAGRTALPGCGGPRERFVALATGGEATIHKIWFKLAVIAVGFGYHRTHAWAIYCSYCRGRAVNVPPMLPS